MNIGFDAKRAYHNSTGLGVYSRTLIKSLVDLYPEHAYYLFNTKQSAAFHLPQRENVHEVLPTFPFSLFPSLWRSSWIKKDLEKYHIDLYHGLRHEIPPGIQNTKIKTVVAIPHLRLIFCKHTTITGIKVFVMRSLQLPFINLQSSIQSNEDTGTLTQLAW